MIGVLGDEALALIVDDDAGEQDLRRICSGGDEHLVQVLGDAARRHTQPDAQPVVVGVAENVGLDDSVVLGAPLLPQRRRVLGDHLRVHHETARGDDHRLGLDRACLVEVLPADTDHRTGFDDQVGCAGLVADLNTEFVGAFDQQVDDHRGTAQLAGDRHRVPSRRGLRLLHERPYLLVAGVRQALGARRDDDLSRVVSCARTENPSPPTS